MDTEFQSNISELKQSLREYINKRINEGAYVEGFQQNIFTLDDESDKEDEMDISDSKMVSRNFSISIRKQQKTPLSTKSFTTLTSPLKGKPASIQFLMESESFLNEMTMIEELSRDTKTVLKRKDKLNRLYFPPTTRIPEALENTNLPSPINGLEQFSNNDSEETTNELPPVTSLSSPLKKKEIVEKLKQNTMTENTAVNTPNRFVMEDIIGTSSNKHVSFALHDEVQEFVSHNSDSESDIGPFTTSESEQDGEQQPNQNIDLEKQLQPQYEEEEEEEPEGFDYFQKAKKKFELLKPFYNTNDRMEDLNESKKKQLHQKKVKTKASKIHNNRKPMRRLPKKKEYEHLNPNDLVSLITKTLKSKKNNPNNTRKTRDRTKQLNRAKREEYIMKSKERLPTLSLSSLLDTVPKYSSKSNCRYLIGRQSKRKNRPKKREIVPISKSNTYRATHLIQKKRPYQNASDAKPSSQGSLLGDTSTLKTRTTPALFTEDDDIFTSALFGESTTPVYPPSFDVIETSDDQTAIISKEEEPELSNEPSNYDTDARIHHIKTLRTYMP